MASKATQAQLRKIYVLAKEAGMDHDLLHLYVNRMAKKESLSELTITEAGAVIDGILGKARGKGEHVTRRQEWKIKDLAKKMGWKDEKGEADEKRLNGFLRERAGVNHYKWLSKKEASGVIEAFKDMLKRQEEDKDGNSLQESI